MSLTQFKALKAERDYLIDQWLKERNVKLLVKIMDLDDELSLMGENSK